MICRVRFLFSLLVLLCVGSPVGYAQSGTATLPSPQVLSRYNLERHWATHAVLNSTRDKVTNIVLDEESVYIQTQNGFVTALDSETGQRRWAQILGRLDTPQYPVVSNSRVVLINSGTKLFAVNKWTGTLLFELALPEQSGTRPVMDEKRVYIGTLSGSVYAFDLEKIYSLYQENLLPQWSYQTRVWRHRTSKKITDQPLLRGNRLTFASETGTLYSVLGETDELVFQMETSAPVSAPIVQYEDMLYVATKNQRLYCIDADRGTNRWTFVSREQIESPPYIINDRVYLFPNDGTLYCLNAFTGDLLWKEPQAIAFLAKTENYIVSEDRNENLLLLSVVEHVEPTPGSEPETADGDAPAAADPAGEEPTRSRLTLPSQIDYEVKIAGRLPLRNFSIRAQNDLTDRIYLATPTGQVICIKERGDGYPEFFKNPEKRPLDPIFFDENAPQEEPPAEPAEQ